MLIATGDPQYFFNGDETDFDGCACGKNGSCKQSFGNEDHVCNCNARSPEWSSDVGTITAKELLPITGFEYGPHDLTEGREPKVEIGPLRCKGKNDKKQDQINL